MLLWHWVISLGDHHFCPGLNIILVAVRQRPGDALDSLGRLTGVVSVSLMSPSGGFMRRSILLHSSMRMDSGALPDGRSANAVPTWRKGGKDFVISTRHAQMGRKSPESAPISSHLRVFRPTALTVRIEPIVFRAMCAGREDHPSRELSPMGVLSWRSSHA